jgi:hypothetical protein
MSYGYEEQYDSFSMNGKKPMDRDDTLCDESMSQVAMNCKRRSMPTKTHNIG